MGFEAWQSQRGKVLSFFFTIEPHLTKEGMKMEIGFGAIRKVQMGLFLRLEIYFEHEKMAHGLLGGKLTALTTQMMKVFQCLILNPLPCAEYH